MGSTGWAIEVIKTACLVSCVLAPVFLGCRCTPGNSLSISVTEDELKVSVTEIDNGIEITKVSKLASIVFVSSPEGKQRFELDIGESVTVTDITKAIDVAVVGR